MDLPSSRCRECPLYRRLGYHVPATRVKGARLAIVGEAPGRDEVTEGRGFVGKSGKYLDSLLKAAKIRREQATVTNVLKCQPQDNKLPLGKDLHLAIECCKEILDKDLEGVEVVIGLGNTPLLAITGLTKITKRRGSVYATDAGAAYVATLHPAALIRQSFVRGENKKITPPQIVVADLVKARRILEGEPWKIDEYFVMHPTSQDHEDFIERCRQPGHYLSIDIEGTKDRPHLAIPTLIGFTAFELVEGKAVNRVTIQAEFESVLDLSFIWDVLVSSIAKVLQNGMYDYMVLTNVGFEVVNWAYDTLYAHHLLYAELPHNLAFIQSIDTFAPYHKDLSHDEDFEADWDK